jgi:hypothetical protein
MVWFGVRAAVWPRQRSLSRFATVAASVVLPEDRKVRVS